MKKAPKKLLQRGRDEAGRPVIGHPAEPVQRCDFCRRPFNWHKRDCPRAAIGPKGSK